MMLEAARVAYYLEMAQTIGRSRPLYDVHVSPWEVLFGGLSYRPDPEHPGVYGLEGAVYKAPRAGPLRIEEERESDQLSERPEVPSPLSRAVLRRQYAHVGPGVIADHMDLCGLSRCLLVPVVRRGADPAEQERLAFDLYAPDPRFALAFCPPPPGTAAEAMESIQAARARHPIRAVKVNANVQGLDLASPAGKASLAHLLSACRALSLPLVVHGGVSRLLEDPRGRSFASLENLESFAWRAAAVPVVLCHAGLFGCPSAVVEALWPRLARLLAQNDNVLVDLSGLSAATLRVVLERVDPGRIVFGSDALYFPPWSAVVRVLFTLEQLGLPVESTFAQLAGANPERHLFGGANPAQSVSDGSPHAH